jgi:hypothetical protein
MGWELFSVPRKKCGILSHIPRIEYPRYIGMHCFFRKSEMGSKTPCGTAW